MPILDDDEQDRERPEPSSGPADADVSEETSGDGSARVAEGIVRLKLEVGNDLADLQDKLDPPESNGEE